MIVERLDLIAFGRFTNCSLNLSAGPCKFHIVYGPNESGKSTSLRALSDLLFGFRGNAVDDYIHKASALRVGGRIVEPESNTTLECIRRKGNKDTLLATDNTTKVSSAELDKMLQGVSRDSFEQQFGISHQQLVEGGMLILEGKGDLSEILFSAGAGLGKLQNIRQELANQSKSIYTDRKSSSPTLYQLLDDWENLKNRLREHSLLPATYNAVRSDLERANAKATSCTTDLSNARRKKEKLEAIKQAISLFLERHWLAKKLEPLSGVVTLAPGFTEKRWNLQSALTAAEQQVKSLESRCREIDQQIATLIIDEVLLANEAAIERLGRNISQHEQSSVTVSEKQSKLMQLRDRIDELGRSLGTMGKAQWSQCEQLSAVARTELVALSKQHSGVMQRVRDTDEKLQAAKATSRKLKSELKNALRPGSPSILDDAIRTVGQPQTMLLAKKKAEAHVVAARETANAKLHQLAGFEGTLEQAVAMVLPPRSTLATSATAIESVQQDVKSIDSKIKTATFEYEQLRAKVLNDSSQLSLPDQSRFDQLIAERNQNLDDLIDASSDERVFPIKRAIELRDQALELDRAHRVRHEYHDQVLRVERDERELVSLCEQLAKRSEDRAAAVVDLKNHIDHWKQLWQTIGVSAGDVDEMRSWCIIQQELVVSACELNELCIELQFATDAIEQAVATLQTALRVSVAKTVFRPMEIAQTKSSTLFDDFEDEDAPEIADEQWVIDPQDFASLYMHATQKNRELSARCQDYEALMNRSELGSNQLDSCQAAAQAANDHLKAWEERWNAAIEPIKSLGLITPESIDVLLNCVEEIVRLRRETIESENELSVLLAAREKYGDAVLSIAMKCLPQRAESLDRGDEISLIACLLTEGKKQRENQKKRTLLVDQLSQARTSANEFAVQCNRVKADLMLLCKEAKCQEFEELAECEKLSEQRRGLEEKSGGIEGSLMVLAKGQAIEAFEAEAMDYQSHSVDDEIESVSREIESLEIEQADAQQSVGRLGSEIKKMDGSDRAAEILQQQQSLLVQIRREAERYAELTIAQDVLARSIENYRRQNEGTVLAKAGKYFAQMTCDQYDGLQVEFDAGDKPRLFAIASKDKSLVPADRLSDGTADALYLAMRIASLDVHLQKNHPIPLVIDDCLIQFDDQRAVASMQILSQLSLRTQVIMFTHHQHIVDLAELKLMRDAFHLHRLART